MSRLQDVILRGTRAGQPAAASVPIGTLYGVTDEGDIVERSSGAAWEAYSPSIAAQKLTFGILIDGAGSPITTGVKGFVRIPLACTITKNTVLSSDAGATPGSIVIDVWRDIYANYPPTVADTIVAAAPPTLSAANRSEDTTLTGWSKSIGVGDVVGFNVNSASTVTRVVLEIEASVP